MKILSKNPNHTISELTPLKDFNEEDVKWCYESILNRSPESERVVSEKLQHHKNFKSLVTDFLRSDEFLSARKENLVTRKNTLSLNKSNVQHEANTEALEKISDRVKQSWTKLGNETPHFSVLTNPDFMPDRILEANHSQKFWESGLNEAKFLVNTLGRFDIVDIKQLTCVEYGCGVGRVTHGLSLHFGKVIGYDISESHLNIARGGAKNNESFELIKSPSEIKILPCDVFYSKIVLQHNPPPLIAKIIDCAFKSIKPGGIAVFQVPTYANGYNFIVSEYLSKPSKNDMEMHCLPQKVIFDMARSHGIHVLEVLEDNFTGASNLFISNTFILQKKSVE